MSWGERSCLEPCRSKKNLSIDKCNVNCEGYIWDKINKPDSKLSDEKIEEKLKSKFKGSLGGFICR